MSDLLSASSLLLAILTTLFGTYYSSIIEVLNLEPNNFKEDDKANYTLAKSVLKTKLIPLLTAATSITLIFIPQSIKIVKTSIEYFTSLEFKTLSYDTISTSYVAVTIFMFILTVNISILFFKVISKMKNINPKRS
ncbi:hypothetical protein LZZ90_01290 [Flavobacterium sp. SM15]|uniref:hypothetical protein n=1 Tax=Flavobacterium sp. SM15 TaxID=2908005 RepID=UPI001EDBAD9D|nr:hypothetical protein [Flavobacterium sp. SM15]MCG2610135.1 hypothetical protein [Flavobacterium sp. SM15]